MNPPEHHLPTLQRALRHAAQRHTLQALVRSVPRSPLQRLKPHAYHKRTLK